MKFSELIPTKDRLPLLHLAVQDVRDQDYDDWEIAVPDKQWIEAARVMVALKESQLPGRRPQARKPRTTSPSSKGAQGADPPG